MYGDSTLGDEKYKSTGCDSQTKLVAFWNGVDSIVIADYIKPGKQQLIYLFSVLETIK